MSKKALPALLQALKGRHNEGVPMGYVLRQLGIALMPALLFVLCAVWAWDLNTRGSSAPAVAVQAGGLQEPGGGSGGGSSGGGLAEPPGASGGLAEPPGTSGSLAEPPGASGGLAEPPGTSGSLAEPPGAYGGLAEPPGSSGGLREPPGTAGAVQEPPAAAGGLAEPPGSSGSVATAEAPARQAAGAGYWIGVGIGALALLAFYAVMSFQHFEVFKMLLSSFFPLLVLILAVLGSIVFGLATPTEAAAVGALGGFLLAVAYKQFNMRVLKESVFLTAGTRDGVLAVRRLGHLLGGLRAAGRAGAGRELGDVWT